MKSELRSRLWHFDLLGASKSTILHHGKILFQVSFWLSDSKPPQLHPIFIYRTVPLHHALESRKKFLGISKASIYSIYGNQFP